MTHSFSLEDGDQPAVRSEEGFAGSNCPYCGTGAVLRSHGDYPEDRRRIELYCNNPMCEVREYTIIALRTDEGWPERADVSALSAVDRVDDHVGPDGEIDQAGVVKDLIEGNIAKRRMHRAR